jgi:YidC/Oxa1 family membrane protein insertase
MEKRALFAALLSGVVLVIWYAFFMPSAPPPAPAPVAPAPLSSATPAGTSGPAAEAAPAPATASLLAPAPEAVAGQAEERIELAGSGWHGWVSSRGGIVRAFILDEYKSDSGEPLDLAGSDGLLGVAGAGPWNDELYAVERIGGAVVRVNGELERVNPEKVEAPQELRGAVEFAGVQDQYFLVALLPDRALGSVRLEAVGAKGSAVAKVAAVGDGGVVEGTVYAGPKEHRTLTAYGRSLDETMSFGIFGFFSVMFLSALRWIHSWSGNWGVAIIVLTAGIRLLLFPLTHKSTVAMKRMQTVQPKLKAIQDRYQERAKKDPNVRARMNQEVMQLYKQEGVNPLGGCLPTLVQLPILWALYTLFAYAIELRHAPLALWIQDLSIKDPTYITPILMTASMVLQQRMTPQVGDPAQRKLFMLMPFIFGFMFMSFPAGLVLYWLVNNVLTIGQQMLTERLLRNRPAPAAV